MANGRVSAHQYAMELERIQAAARKGGVMYGPQRGGTPSSPGDPAPSKGGGGGGLGKMMAVAGTVTAAVATAKQVLDLSDAYTGLENRLRQVGEGQFSLNQLMEKTKEIANSTRSDWAATSEAFVRFNGALKPLGKSQAEVLNFTKTLNMALQQSGASASEAQAGLLQLTQGLAAGRLQGDEFRSITESLPFLLDLFAKKLGVTRGELKQLASEGKITSEVVYESLMSQSAAIETAFGKSVPTAAQQWTVFKNELIDMAGQFVKQTNLIPKLGEMLKGIVAILKPLVTIVGELISFLSDLKDGFNSVMDKLGPFGKAVKLALDPLGSAKKALGAIADFFSGPTIFEQMEKFKVKAWKEGTEEGRKFNAMMQVQLEIIRQIGMAAPATTQALKALINDPWADKRNMIAKGWSQFASLVDHAGDIIKKQTKKYEDGAKAMKTYATEVEGLHSKFAKENQFTGEGTRGISPSDNGVFSPEFSRTMDEAILKQQMFNNSLATDDQLAELQSAFERINGPMWQYNRGLSVAKQLLDDGAISTDQYAKEIDRLSRELAESGMDEAMRQKMQTVAESINLVTDSLVDYILTGEGGFESMMASLDRLILKWLMLKAVQGLTGAGGGDIGTVLSNAMFGGGFATGGKFVVPGTGGHDSSTVAFRATPGETVSIGSPASTTRANDKDGGMQSGANAGGGTTIINQYDRRALLSELNTSDGRTTIYNIIKNMPGWEKR